MTNAPKCVGIIMDGNRRWAKAHGHTIMEGHMRGLDKLREVAKWASGAGIEELIVYAFSSENWNRAPAEIDALMTVFGRAFDSYFEEFIAEGGRLRFIGDLERMPDALRGRMQEAEERSASNIGSTLTVAVSYGGRAEIVRAVNTLLARTSGPVTEEDVSANLWTNGHADPDLIIRTSGEKRLSNFLPWQSVYSELFFVDSYWPAFSREEFDGILAEYAARERRLGK